ncbi:hypothetical protein K443DRAFT_13768 [Laccaria amethystina LaAM-08-1]|uniref:Unplaced genomic scaffold K443scaffold_391, whole genome shotgun sequence n=1 Tax=Laccaria amethystina LaAM-08-1 TaxID=1095629 RepID=A0A0C9X723_9AGAR|nr:hypothetical protein K443DRAFT_13768 [Laccaria amethystina LaAM-08-1]
MPTIRKPDVILARKQAISASQNGGHLDPTRAPLQPFDWPIIDRTVADKCYKKKIDPAPASYSTSLSLYIPVAKNVRKPRPIPDHEESTPSVEESQDDELDAEGENEEPGDDEIVQLAGREDDEAGEDGEDGEGQRREQTWEDGEDKEGKDKAALKKVFLHDKYRKIRTVRTETALVGGGGHPSEEIKTHERIGNHTSAHKSSPNVQNALYASEMLNRGVYIMSELSE